MSSEATVRTNAALTPLQRELVRTAVNDYYHALAEKRQTPALGHDFSKFELVSGRLRLKAHPGLDLVNSRDDTPLALSTIASRRGGTIAIRDGLGFVDWQPRCRRFLAPVPSSRGRCSSATCQSLQRS